MREASDTKMFVIARILRDMSIGQMRSHKVTSDRKAPVILALSDSLGDRWLPYAIADRRANRGKVALREGGRRAISGREGGRRLDAPARCPA